MIKFFKNLSPIISILFFTIFFNNNLYANNHQNICNDNVSQILYSEKEKNQDYSFQYLEKRNDIGIIFDFFFDEENQKIIIKRDSNGYPIIRFSLFEKDLIKPGLSALKIINDKDLSSFSDTQLKRIIKNNKESKIELVSGEQFSIEPNNYYLNDFNLSEFDILSIHNIDTNKGILELSFKANFTNKRNDISELFKKYEEKNNEFILDGGLHEICPELRKKLPWPIEVIYFEEFKYDADVREGLNNKEQLIKSVFDFTNNSKNEVYTLRNESGVASFRQFFDFEKFPYDTQKLVITIRSKQGSFQNENQSNNFPEGSINLITPEVGPFINLTKFLNKDVNKLRAWEVLSATIKSREIVDNKFYDTFAKKIISRSENVLDIEIVVKRNPKHYFYKIILPVFLILCVAWYVLWIPTEKYEARLNTSIISLLALIAYNFVFQDDIPKLEYLTDLDKYILMSFIFCCIPVFLSIGFSKFISRNQKKVMKINKIIRYWGGFIYIFLTLSIFNTF